MIYYYAYGSNLHPRRLLERAPSANLIGVARFNNHRLHFHKKSNDGSGKCNMLRSKAGSDSVYGAIYRLNIEDRYELDRCEGKGYGYVDSYITLNYGNNEYNCFTYLAQQSHIAGDLRPYHWYKKLVILGARYLEFPESYVSSIEAIEAVEDADPTRRQEKGELIERIINYR